jgi:hypothetical protein
VLRFSDERRIARYERTYTFMFERRQKGTIISTLSNTEVDERRT